MPESPPSAPPALLAEVTRGPAVESRHWGHVAVVDADGALLYAAGDAERPIFPRSSLKPLQALAGVARGTAERFALSDAEVAVTCASHAAEPRHRAAVAGILQKIDARETDLRCGPHPVAHLPTRDELIRTGRSPTPVFSNCSGKHAGMLALARVLETPLHGYWEVDHGVQVEVKRVLRRFAGTRLEDLRWGTDGCGVPNYLVTLRELALGFARLANPAGLEAPDAGAARRIAEAMVREPEMVRGEGGLDSVVMRSLPGVLVMKGGAEGCEAVGLLGRGLGIAVKVEDGSPRPLAPLVMALLERFGALPDPLPSPLTELLRPEVLNTRAEVVGEVRATLP